MALTFEAATRLVARALKLTPDLLNGSLRPATLSDLPHLLAFRREHLGATVGWDDAAYLSWRYRLGRPQHGFGDLWMLPGAAGPLAMLGTEELPAQLGELALTGARVMDLLARADLQETGIGAWLNQSIFRKHDFALAMGANQNSAGIVKRLYQPLPSRQTSTHPIDLRPYVGRKVQGRMLASAASAAGTVGMGALRSWRRLTRPSTIALTTISRFDDGMLPMRRTESGQLHVVRDAAYLNRRLFENPRRRHEALAASRGDRAAGYIAWMIVAGGHADGTDELQIVDWQAGDDRALGQLLMGAVARAAAAGCACVRLRLQDPTTLRVARRHGFMRLEGSTGKVVGVHAADSSLLARLTASEWALTDITDDVDGY